MPVTSVVVSTRWGRMYIWANTVSWMCAALAGSLVVSLLPLSWAILLVGGIVLALVAFVQPAVVVPLLAFSVPLGLLCEILVGGASMGLPEALLAVAATAWLGQSAARRRLIVPPGPLLWPLVVWVWAIALSFLTAFSLRVAMTEFLKWMEVLVLYVMARSVLRPRWIPWLIAAMLAAGALQGLIGLYQFIWQAGPEPFRLGRFVRAFGTFAQPNPYAGYLGMVAPLGLSLTLWSLGAIGREKQKVVAGIRTLAYAATAVLCVAGILASWSRGAWIGLSAAVLTVMVAQSRHSRALLACLVVLAALLGLLNGFNLLPASISARLADLGSFMGPLDLRSVEVTDANFSVVERLAHWQAGLAMFADHPWLGVGAGSFAVAYPTYALPRWEDALGHAHNVYINIAGETGLIGLLAFLSLWATAFLATARGLSRQSGYMKAILVGVLGVLVHISVHSFFDVLFVQRMYLHLVLLLALI